MEVTVGDSAMALAIGNKGKLSSPRFALKKKTDPDP
jgi:hypothetical protein